MREQARRTQASDNRIWRDQLDGAAWDAEISGGFRKSRILEPLGSSKSFASGSPRAMSVISKFCVPNRGSCRLLMRLTPSCGEYQNSRFAKRGLLLPIAPVGMTVVSLTPTVSSPPTDCLPRSSCPGEPGCLWAVPGVCGLRRAKQFQLANVLGGHANVEFVRNGVADLDL